MQSPRGNDSDDDLECLTDDRIGIPVGLIRIRTLERAPYAHRCAKRQAQKGMAMPTVRNDAKIDV